MEAKRIIVKTHFDAGLSAGEIFKLVKNVGINKRFIYRTINRLRDTGSIKNRPGSGRNRTARTKERIKIVRDKVRRNPRRSSGKLALETGTSKTSMRRILNIDLGLKPYRKIKRHGLSAKNKEDRVKRCQQLLKRRGAKSVEKIIFSDEKMWTLQESYNAQNDRIYSVSIQDIPQNVRTVQRYQNTSAVMVWGAVSHNGKLPLIFIEKGVKINSRYYQKEILDGHLKDEALRLYPNRNWIFQQDSAPAHKANINQAWCKANCPDFISAQEWPASSPDLNPLDYFVWGKLEAIVNSKQHRSVEALKRTILREWEKLPIKEVRAAIASWRDRLQAVIDHNGDRFE
jgi:transposase